MENNTQSNLAKEARSVEALPSLIRAITANEIAGFDSVNDHHNNNDVKVRLKSSSVHPLSPSFFAIEAAAAAAEAMNQDDLTMPERTHSVSISMPPSPIHAHLHKANDFFANDETKFYSQPMPKGPVLLNHETVTGILPLRNPRMDRLKDTRYDNFKTWSGRLERQLSNLRGIHNDEDISQEPTQVENLPPVDRYFDALEGPELETLRASEEIILPEDKQWPFLLRFPISSFGICLGVSSQAIMWKALSTSESTKFLKVGPVINLVLWFISVALVSIVAFIYGLKMIFYFEAVRREYYHPIRVNFFFAPWIALLFLALGVPPLVSQTLHASLWYVLMTPIFILELKIYGQWMSGGQRRLSKVANPSNHLSIVGNFVGALLGASMGLKEGPIFFFAVGLAHYTVLFVTLYQRLPTNETLPKELHPVFFLFVAAPSVASMAWARIQGSFDYGSRIAYFIAMFLYFSLAVRVNFFRGFRFSLSWWAYTFPMTGAAIATIKYMNEVTNILTKSLSIGLCLVATLIVSGLFVTTIIHAFVFKDLFPNDIGIAISERKPPKSGSTRKWFHRRSISSDSNIEQYLKYSKSSDEKEDIEASTNNSTDSDAKQYLKYSKSSHEKEDIEASTNDSSDSDAKQLPDSVPKDC